MANEKRLIDANKLEEMVKISDKPAWMVVRDAPTVDAVEVVYGRWINPYMNRYGHPCHCCSVCGFKASYQDKNYCPNCGADMRERNGVTLDNQGSKWISVNDRLPEHPEYDWVLVQVKMNPEDYYGVPHIAELRNGTWYDEDDLPLEEFRSVIVTHWMPMPQPPKGE